MNITNGLNKRVVEIYRGGELVWEMPTVFLKLDSLVSGSNMITGVVHPSDAKVTCEFNYEEHKAVVFDGKLTITLDKPTRRGDGLVLNVERPGWKKAAFYFRLK